MKRMKTIYAIVALLLPLCVAAQPRFVPDTELIKLGDVLFQKPKQVTFGFTNRGNEPLLITEVHPSCGCVAVSYTGSPVEPGERGTVVATYDAKMLGTFYRDIEIVTNASDEPVYLALQGCVVTELRDFSDGYPIDLGNIRLATNYIEFEDVNKGDHPIAELTLVNAEKTAFHPELMHLPPYITAHSEPESIPAGQTGVIYIELDSEKLPMMGLNKTSIYLARYLGDKIGESNEIRISAVLLPSFSDQTPEQLARAPQMELSTERVEIGPFAGRDKLTATVHLSNHGKTPLQIQQLQVFNEAVSVSLGNRTLAPGKTTKLKITVSAHKLQQSQISPRVLLITNDPQHAKEIIYIDVKH